MNGVHKLRKNPVTRKNGHAPPASAQDSNKSAKSGVTPSNPSSTVPPETSEDANARLQETANISTPPRQDCGPLQRNWRLPTAGICQLSDDTHTLITPSSEGLNGIDHQVTTGTVHQFRVLVSLSRRARSEAAPFTLAALVEALQTASAVSALRRMMSTAKLHVAEAAWTRPLRSRVRPCWGQ